MRRLTLALGLLLTGCGSSGPSSTHTSSSQFSTLPARIDFLQRYLSFRRNYEALDFLVDYRNGQGFGPSEWDIRLIAKVPASELSAWVPTGVMASTSPDRAWLGSVPTDLDLTGVSEWYVDQGRIIGIDRKKSVVVYRTLKY